LSLAGVLQGCDVPWDVNDDGVVNMVDIQLVADHWRAPLGDPNYVSDYDLNSDQIINVVDIMLVASRWHTAEGNEDYEPDYDLNGNGKI